MLRSQRLEQSRGKRRKGGEGTKRSDLGLGGLDATACEREETLEERLDDEFRGAAGVHLRR